MFHIGTGGTGSELLAAEDGFAGSLVGGKHIEVLRFLDLLGRDAVLFVVLQLFLATAVGFVDGQLHAVRYLVGIHDDHAVHVTGGTPGSLCQ